MFWRKSKDVPVTNSANNNMVIKYTIETAIAGLKRNKVRTFLTVLGIVIGITAIILIVSLGKGAEELILSQVQGLGSKTIVVVPGREPSGLSDTAQIFSDSLKDKDLEALQRKTNVPHLKTIIPIVFGAETVSYQNDTYHPTIFGATDEMAKVFDLSIKDGRFLSPEEGKGFGNSAIIGSRVKDELFGNSDAVGKRIRVKNYNFKVVGVMPKKGQVSFFNFDETIIVPYSTAQHYVFGIKYLHRFIIEADSEENISQTVTDIKRTIRDSHGITDPDKDDFFVNTQEDLANRLSSIANVLTIFLASVAAISLLVGGVGIMNIMLVSVTERTREIGLRKAVGATSKNIRNQFITEAVFLTAIGGVVGVLLGSFLSFAISTVLSRTLDLNWVFTFPVGAALLGLSVSALVGIVFGLYPAIQASKKSPIEALRYE